MPEGGGYAGCGERVLGSGDGSGVEVGALVEAPVGGASAVRGCERLKGKQGISHRYHRRNISINMLGVSLEKPWS